MTNEAILSLTAYELAQAIREKKVTSEEAVLAVFKNIDENESDLHAYLSFWKEESLKQAQACDAIVAGSTDPEGLPPFLGVPFAVKDNLLLSGRRSTCASKMLEDFVAPYTATCVEKLQAAGAIIIGKTNMDEFGMGASTEHSYFGTTYHPMDKNRVPGGSSGGSAAAVASGSAFGALGTDTGGSIRQPADYCGLVGLRPTYGTVSRHGLVAFSSSMDVAGPIARDTRDAAAILNVISGADEKDQTSVSSPKIDISAMENYEVAGKRIGIPKELLGQGTQTEALEKARAYFASNGAEIEEFDMPILAHAVAIYYILSSAEASSNLSRYDGIRYGYRDPDATDLSELYTKTRSSGFGLEVKRRILLGNYVLSSEHFNDCYRQAERAREKLKRSFEKAFEKYDLILCPTAPGVAPELGKIDQDPLASYMADLYTVPASLAGIPAVSVPCGTFREGLPCGVQLLAPRFGEQEILGAARFLEKQQRKGAGV
ncbi:MAG: Asp-tRNA(Asn)/Glu-tRNA(Gln) amidotransferase subunit GatA [Clostridiales bacterium]|nr:Asp-tRNA(Asn)/Glu-tRNA(Gln) amidotransferase subunit GatA [Clostridiales bacterium]